ncbi:hypothetical protein MKK69_18535 [Methylobacterium sp. J-026]|uniref:hypothetical protein n=1 Tax=Methylobacterium sp. J-026 TaxID=2836624 RepID=UPI001FBAE376|nr:hypothetical protein [Methylobacterium sp. J-026]MCJ2136022.1 hypothetical protein [Methylobacterium sp. J-026]
MTSQELGHGFVDPDRIAGGVPRPPVALPGITLATAMMWASYTVPWAIPADDLDRSAAPGGVAFIGVVGVPGGAFNPIILGVKIATGSMVTGMSVMGRLLAVGALVMPANQLPRPA